MIPAAFAVQPWSIKTIETVPALGDYSEVYWLPILHPAAYLLGRRLARLAFDPCLHVGSAWLAMALGLTYVDLRDDPDPPEPSPTAKPNTKLLNHSLKRLVKYHLIRFQGGLGNVCEVRTHWPRLNPGLLASLPESLQRDEPRWFAASVGASA